MLRRLAIVLALGCGIPACEAPPGETPRLVTVDRAPGLHLSLRELPPPVLEALGLSYGLAVVRTDRLAQDAGLRVGDVIYGINHTRIANAEEFNRLLAEEADAAVGLLVRRGKTDFYVMLMPQDLRPGAPSRDTLLRT